MQKSVQELFTTALISEGTSEGRELKVRCTATRLLSQKIIHVSKFRMATPDEKRRNGEQRNGDVSYETNRFIMAQINK